MTSFVTPTSFARMYPVPDQCGLIKQSAEDFYVREVAIKDLLGSGEHVYLKVRKRHANTHWVARQIADFLVLRINLLERLLIPCLFPAGLNLILPVPVLENLFFKLLFVLSLGILFSLLNLLLGCPTGHS